MAPQNLKWKLAVTLYYSYIIVTLEKVEKLIVCIKRNVLDLCGYKVFILLWNDNLCTQFKRLALGFSLMLSLVMGLMFMITSSMMSSIYERFCSYIKDHNDYYYGFDKHECEEPVKHFLILPILGYFTMLAWVRHLCVTVTKHCTLK